MAQSIEELSFELTASALAEQERAVAGMRLCASTVLGAASVAGSFLGAKVAHGALEGWSILALASFGVCFGSAIWVLRPHAFGFALRGETVLAAADVGSEQELRNAYRAISVWIAAQMDVNSRKIADLSIWVTLSCVSLAAEIMFWTLAVIG